MPETADDITAGIANIGAEPTPDSTPAPAPAPTPTPEPTPAPAPAPEAKPSLPFDDDIPAPTKPAPRATKQVEIPEDQKSARGGTLKEFRENYETTKKERDELAQKVKALETAREEGTRAEVAKATSELNAKMEEIRKRNEELETEVKFTNFTRSSEYKDKYEKPLEDAWKEAISDINGAVIELEDGTERAAGWQDIQQLIALPAIAAAKRATELFGSAAPAVLQHRNTIINIERARKAAIEDYKVKGAEREREMAAKASQQMERVFATFNSTIQDYEKADGTLYGRPQDPEAQKFWDAGDKLIALAVKRQGLDTSLPEEEQSAVLTKAQAAVAARARAFGPLRHRVMTLERELEELRGKNQKLSKSEPGQGSDRKSEPNTEDEDITAGIMRL